MEWLKLIGILVVVVGFVLKFDTMATVVVAGLVTGLVAGMSPMEILETLGNSFISNRTATLFVLTLSAIGLCERNGLKDKAVDLIKKMKSATTGRVLAVWQAVRTVASAFSLRIGGHPQFIRPLINPWPRVPPWHSSGRSMKRMRIESRAWRLVPRTMVTSSPRTASWAPPARC